MHHNLNRSPQPCDLKPLGAVSMVIFQLGTQTYAIGREAVREIVPLPMLSRLPNMPRAVEGYFNLRGTILAALRLDQLFGTQKRAPSIYTPLLILNVGEMPAALLVDGVANVSLIPDSQIVPIARDASFNECIQGVASTSGGHVLIVDPSRVLLKAEQHRIAEFTAIEQARLDIAGANQI